MLFQKPLAECHEYLLQQGLAVNVELMELWMREYQVLPARTHPLMNMDASSGYLLSGTKVDPSKVIKAPKEQVLQLNI